MHSAQQTRGRLTHQCQTTASQPSRIIEHCSGCNQAVLCNKTSTGSWEYNCKNERGEEERGEEKRGNYGLLGYYTNEETEESYKYPRTDLYRFV